MFQSTREHEEEDERMSGESEKVAEASRQAAAEGGGFVFWREGGERLGID